MQPLSRKCRICGARFRSIDALKHEIQCLQRSEENIDTKSGSSNEEESQTVEKEDEGKAGTPATRSVSFEDEDDEDDDFWETGFDSAKAAIPTKLASLNVPPSLRSEYRTRNSKDSKPRRTVRSPSGCHAHNSKYSGRRSSMPYDRKKPKNLFPPTKKYRYYPVTCEYCGDKFQPNRLKAHQRRAHLGEREEGPRRRRTQSSATKRGWAEEPRRSAPSKSVGAIPRRLQICYICGRMYGSKSLKIHEPKCLDKWRIQNEQLPPNRRAPEPVKQEPLQGNYSPTKIPP